MASIENQDGIEFDIDELITDFNDLKSYVIHNEFSLFDVIPKDHVLSFEESKGFAQLGSYVYRDPIMNERYGYPNFYDRLIGEYQNITNTRERLISVGGTLTENNGVYSGFVNDLNYLMLPCSIPWSTASSVSVVFKVNVTNSTTSNVLFGNVGDSPLSGGMVFRTSDGTRLYIWASTNKSSWTTTQFDTGIDLTTGEQYIKLDWNGSSFKVSKSTDGQNWTTGNTLNTAPIADTRQWICSTGSQSQLYMRGSIDLNGTYINVNGQRWWDGTAFIYKNPNGHKFYDISYKPVFDRMAQESHNVWYYGIDISSLRIFLPRDNSKVHGELIDSFISGNNWYRLYSDGWCEQGGLVWIYNGANGYSTVKLLKPYKDMSYTITMSASDTAAGYSDGGAVVNTGVEQGAIRLSNSSIGLQLEAGYNNGQVAWWRTAGYVAETQITPFKKSEPLIPYMVVGNTIKEEAITRVTEITTSENDTLPLFSSLYLEGKANNPAWILAGGQVVNGSIYRFAYQELVEELINPKYNLKVIEVNNVQPGVDYSTYWRISLANQYFVCPIRTSERVLVAQKKATLADPSWYNLYSDGWCEQGGYSPKASSSTYDGYTVVFPRAFIDTNYMFSKTTSVDSSSATGTYASGSTYATNGKTTISIKTGTEQWASGFVWEAEGYTAVPALAEYTEPHRLYFKVANAVQNLELLDAGAVLEALNEKMNVDLSNCTKPYIVETYVNGQSWYRIWSDGWCEQGGWVSVTASAQLITLLKPYSNAYYTILLGYSQWDGWSNGGQLQWNSQTNSTFRIYGQDSIGAYWKTEGYLA